MKDLKRVRSVSWEARIKWIDIGLEIGINHDVLEEIRTKYGNNPSDCYTEMLSIWLKSISLKPTLAALADALKSRLVGYEQLSEKVRQMQIPEYTNDGMNTVSSSSQQFQPTDHEPFHGPEVSTPALPNVHKKKGCIKMCEGLEAKALEPEVQPAVEKSPKLDDVKSEKQNQPAVEIELQKHSAVNLESQEQPKVETEPQKQSTVKMKPQKDAYC